MDYGRISAEDVQRVFEDLGGYEGLLAWARSDEKNLSVFYRTIYPKLLNYVPSKGFSSGEGFVINLRLDEGAAPGVLSKAEEKRSLRKLEEEEHMELLRKMDGD